VTSAGSGIRGPLAASMASARAWSRFSAAFWVASALRRFGGLLANPSGPVSAGQVRLSVGVLTGWSNFPIADPCVCMCAHVWPRSRGQPVNPSGSTDSLRLTCGFASDGLGSEPVSNPSAVREPVRNSAGARRGLGDEASTRTDAKRPPLAVLGVHILDAAPGQLAAPLGLGRDAVDPDPDRRQLARNSWYSSRLGVPCSKGSVSSSSHRWIGSCSAPKVSAR
jgi:hypothetical protein